MTHTKKRNIISLLFIWGVKMKFEKISKKAREKIRENYL